jgi:hypothetical protein
VELDVDLIAQLAGQSHEWVHERLPPLERANLVTFDGERYAFAAPLIAQAIRADFLTRGQRSAHRREAVVALAARSDVKSRVLRAELWTDVEAGRESFREAMATARVALAEGGVRTAQRALIAAERALAARGDEERAEFAVLQAEFASLKAGRGGGV